MSKKDFTRMTPGQRRDALRDAVNSGGLNDEQIAIALAGLAYQSGKQRDKKRRAGTECVVEMNVTVGTMNGEVLKETLYLTNDYIPGTAELRVGVRRDAKVFQSERDAKRALAFKQDAANRAAGHKTMSVGKVVEYADLKIPGDALTSAGIERSRTLNGGLGL